MARVKTKKPVGSSFGNILVVGDSILDIYHYGKAYKIASESPTIVVEDQTTRVSWGGAALFVRNVLELGGSVSFVSLFGDDDFTKREKDFTHPNLKKFFIREKGRKTTVKERFWADGYTLLKWNHLDNRVISAETKHAILAIVKKELPFHNKLVVSEYRHGLITEDFANELVATGKKFSKPVYVDSQIQRDGNHLWYRGATLMCLNRKEAESVFPDFSFLKISESLQRMHEILDCEHIVVKLGAEGSVALVGERFIQTPPHIVKALDTTGAGDAFFAPLVISECPPSEEVLRQANIWAGLSTTIVGTEPPQRE